MPGRGPPRRRRSGGWNNSRAARLLALWITGRAGRGTLAKELGYEDIASPGRARSRRASRRPPGGLLRRERRRIRRRLGRSEEHTSELQSLMRISYAVFCLKKNTTTKRITTQNIP